MTADNSPMYAQGVADGEMDCEIVASCPPGVPLGPTPPNPAYPVMYLRGYEEAWALACPHLGCARCERRQRGEEAMRGGA